MRTGLQKISFLFLVSALALGALAQDCDSNYFSLGYEGKYYNTFRKAISTSRNETLIIGNLLAPRGWITKLSAQGTVLWSNEYTAGYYANGEKYFSNLRMNDIVAAPDSTFIIVGSISRDGEFIDRRSVPPQVTCGVVMNVDRYGNTIWSRMFISAYSIGNDGPDLSFSNVIRLKNDNYVAYLANKDERNVAKIVCFTKDGSVKWENFIDIGRKYDVNPDARRAMLQTHEGNIVVADVVYSRNVVDNVQTISEQHFHLYSLDQNTGARKWESSYECPAGDVAGIVHLAEMPDASLSLLTSLAVSSDLQPPLTMKAVNIITTANGYVTKTTSYYPVNGSAEVVDAYADPVTGNQLLLMKEGNGNTSLVGIDATGALQSQKGYAQPGGGIPPAAFLFGANGYKLFFSEPLQPTPSRNMHILITDPAGNVDCSKSSVQMIQANAFWSSNSYAVQMQSVQSSDGPFAVFSLQMVAEKYPLSKSTDCQRNIPCCLDVIDTTHITSVILCNGSTYKLPDNSIVTYGGDYNVTLTTAKGCDSTIFFNVKMLKNPSELLPIPDTCLADRDSLVLAATPGFESYTWMNTVTTRPSFTVYGPGIYSLRVSNNCGTKTDNVEVYQECDFPVYMPTAFTPNNDGLNDVYRVPPENRNRLVSLDIYNRWGQLIFSSSNMNVGWDGTVKGIPQASDVFVYKLRMRGLTGKEFRTSGRLTLIR